MRLLSIALLLLQGCVFIDDTEHAARLALADSGDSGDSGDTGDVQVERYTGTLTLRVLLADDEVSCAGSASFDLRADAQTGGDALTGEGSCLIDAPETEGVDGVQVLVTLEGELNVSGIGSGSAELTADREGRPADWTATLDDSAGLLTGTLAGEVRLSAEGKGDVEGAWEATRQDTP